MSESHLTPFSPAQSEEGKGALLELKLRSRKGKTEVQTPWPAGDLGALWPHANRFKRAQKLWSVSSKCAKSTGGGEVNAQPPTPSLPPPQGA